jgi:hypothetical protein
MGLDRRAARPEAGTDRAPPIILITEDYSIHELREDPALRLAEAVLNNPGIKGGLYPAVVCGPAQWRGIPVAAA